MSSGESSAHPITRLFAVILIGLGIMMGIAFYLWGVLSLIWAQVVLVVYAIVTAELESLGLVERVEQSGYTVQEEEMIKRRLRDLGYL